MSATSFSIRPVQPPAVTHGGFTEEQVDLLLALFLEAEVPFASLPYTADFEDIYISFIFRSGVTASRNLVWRALLACRNNGRLAAARGKPAEKRCRPHATRRLPS